MKKFISEKKICGLCNGDGEWRGHKCPRCDGAGYYYRARLVDDDEPALPIDGEEN
jgi:DnaJ-class molecular chaperone